ncbi:DUF167 domain-containing protein [Seohaeicola nanhaiensis]|uniref:UPF0235 protein ACFO5X_00925 n=2 Tax=Seohaeicola nanhaiensis TaxID=1387282 RepID=A0ABV9KAK2_9RHOB
MARALPAGQSADMAKPRDIPDLTRLAVPGAEIAVKATPRAARARLVEESGGLRAYVTVPPEDGKANAAVQALLAAAMGVAPSHLTLVRGQTARNKVFVYLDGAGASR